MKTVKKGSRYELKVKKILESKGYSVEKEKNIPFQKTHDFFGVADLISSNRKEIKLIAVTDKHNKSRARKKLKSFRNHPTFVKKEIWYYDKAGKFFVESI